MGDKSLLKFSTCQIMGQVGPQNRLNALSLFITLGTHPKCNDPTRFASSNLIQISNGRTHTIAAVALLVREEREISRNQEQPVQFARKPTWVVNFSMRRWRKL